MVRCFDKVKQILQWGKIFLPLSALRYYPPRFILRNPLIKGVNGAFNAGNDVVVMVFHLKNKDDLEKQLSPIHHAQFVKNCKKYIRINVKQIIGDQSVITLHDFLGTGISLFLKLDRDQSVAKLDTWMRRISYEVERTLVKLYPIIEFQFETGFMFIESKYHSTEEAVVRAHSQALAMAEKNNHLKMNAMQKTMKKIIEERNIHLLAQPIIDVPTNEIRAWEILTRGPKGWLEKPMPLFSVARQTGMLYELELLIFEKALKQINSSKRCQDFFINFTPLTFGNLKFTHDIKRIIQQYRNVSPKQIIIEITEQDSIEGMKDFHYNLEVLRLMGFRIAVDDTGAGYANLSTISEIMPDFIKIDRSLIEDIDKNPLKESMLKGLLLVAKEAGSIVVAEGIERAEEADVLTRNNVDLAQGFYYARPADLSKGMAT